MISDILFVQLTLVILMPLSLFVALASRNALTLYIIVFSLTVVDLAWAILGTSSYSDLEKQQFWSSEILTIGIVALTLSLLVVLLKRFYLNRANHVSNAAKLIAVFLLLLVGAAVYALLKILTT
jgi:hypothetical protein